MVIRKGLLYIFCFVCVLRDVPFSGHIISFVTFLVLDNVRFVVVACAALALNGGSANRCDPNEDMSESLGSELQPSPVCGEIVSCSH